MQATTIWWPLGSRDALRPVTTGLPAVVGTAAQAMALMVMEPYVSAPIALALAVCYWAVCVACSAMFSRMHSPWTPTSVILALTASASIAGGTLGFTASRVPSVERPWLWALLVSIESAPVLVLGAQVQRQRQEFRGRVLVREALLSDTLRRVDRVSSAREAIADIARQSLTAAQTAALAAQGLLDAHADVVQVDAYIDSALREPARTASHAVHAYQPQVDEPAPLARPGVSAILADGAHLGGAFLLVGAFGLPFGLFVAAFPISVLGQLAGAVSGYLVARVVVLLARTLGAARAAFLAIVIGCFAGILVTMAMWWGNPVQAFAMAVAMTPLAVLVALLPAALAGCLGVSVRL